MQVVSHNSSITSTVLTKDNSGDSHSSSIVIVIFICMFVVGMIALFIYNRCCVKKTTNSSTSSKNYRIKMIDGNDIKMRLNDVSTGSPDVPGWDQEKDVVKAERMIGAI